MSRSNSEHISNRLEAERCNGPREVTGANAAGGGDSPDANFMIKRAASKQVAVARVESDNPGSAPMATELAAVTHGHHIRHLQAGKIIEDKKSCSAGKEESREHKRLDRTCFDRVVAMGRREEPSIEGEGRGDRGSRHVPGWRACASKRPKASTLHRGSSTSFCCAERSGRRVAFPSL